MFRNRFIFYGEGLLAPCPTPKLEDHPLSSVHGCLFNVFATNVHSWRPSFYPRPKDKPCCGDRDPPNMGYYFHHCGNVISLQMLVNHKKATQIYLFPLYPCAFYSIPYRHSDISSYLRVVTIMFMPLNHVKFFALL
jgi:hypothetical protein